MLKGRSTYEWAEALINIAHPQIRNELIKLTEKISSNGPFLIAKFAIGKGLQVNIDTAMSIESDMFSMGRTTEDKNEGLGEFVEKRK